MDQNNSKQADKRSERKEGRSSRKEVRQRLQCSHVIEGQVQLLTESLALQLLSIHFIWRRTHTQTRDRDRCTERKWNDAKGQETEKFNKLNKNRTETSQLQTA